MKAVRIAPRSPRASRWQLNVFTKTRKNGRWYHFRYHSVFGGLRQHRGEFVQPLAGKLVEREGFEPSKA